MCMGYNQMAGGSSGFLQKLPLGKTAKKYVEGNPVAKKARKQSSTVDRTYRDFTQGTGY